MAVHESEHLINLLYHSQTVCPEQIHKLCSTKYIYIYNTSSLLWAFMFPFQTQQMLLVWSPPCFTQHHQPLLSQYKAKTNYDSSFLYSRNQVIHHAKHKAYQNTGQFIQSAEEK